MRRSLLPRFRDRRLAVLPAGRATIRLWAGSRRVPLQRYRGDGTTCPTENNTCNKVNDVVQVYRACCLSDGMCINTTQSVCGAAWVAGTFNASVTCEDAAPSLCPSSLQRCCFTDGRCELHDPRRLFGPRWDGDFGSNDLPAECLRRVRSRWRVLCATAGACSVITESQCRAGGGVFQGNGTNCTLAMGTCPGFGACCRSDGACFDEVTAAQCGILTGDVADYQGDGSFCDAPCAGLRPSRRVLRRHGAMPVRS